MVTYNATSWNTGQAVPVSAGHDDGMDEAVIVKHTVASDDRRCNYAARYEDADVTVTVNDDDPALGVTVDTDGDADNGVDLPTLAFSPTD